MTAVSVRFVQVVSDATTTPTRPSVVLPND